MKYPTVSRWCSELQERTSARYAEGSGSANQNHSTSLARAISYLAEVERLSLLMPTRLARSSILCFTALLLFSKPLHLSLSPHQFFFYPRFFLSSSALHTFFFSPPTPTVIGYALARCAAPATPYVCAEF